MLGVGASVGLMAVYSKWDETALLSLTGIGLGGAAVFAVFLGLLAVTHQVRDISPQLELEIHIFRTPKLLTDRGVVQDIVHYQTSLINTGEEDARDLELSWDSSDETAVATLSEPSDWARDAAKPNELTRSAPLHGKLVRANFVCSVGVTSGSEIRMRVRGTNCEDVFWTSEEDEPDSDVTLGAIEPDPT